MSSSATAFVDLPVHHNMGIRELSHPLCNFGAFDNIDINKVLPGVPSLLRLANTRFLMSNIDTDTLPDWDTLKAVTFDHDLITAIKMISIDTINGFRIARKTSDGGHLDDTFRDEMDMLDEHVDMAEIYRTITYDELRYGNAFVRRNVATLKEKKTMYALEIISPHRIVDMQLGPHNEPKWWVIEVVNEDSVYGSYVGYERIAYVDPKYSEQFKSSGNTDARIVGEASNIVHFKGDAPKYQKWGIGIGQIAKMLIEVKVDMLVDFGKIIKKEAATREVFFVDVKGLNPTQRDAKIARTVTEVTEQRKRGTILVMGKKGKDDALEAQYIGSEGKVLDNFSMHYRADVLQSIRILTRIPPSFWLGEATNKATINKQVTVYNGFLFGLRYFNNKRFKRQIVKDYLQQQTKRALRLGQLPEFAFSKVVYMDAFDQAAIDDIYIRNGAKSRIQVAEENDFRTPEEDGVSVPGGEAKGFGEMVLRNHLEEGIGIGVPDETGQ